MIKAIEKNIAKQKTDIDRWYQEKSEKCPLPLEVECVCGIPYINDQKECHKMDIYYPKEHKGALPVVMSFHGGGLLLCDRSVNRWFCADLAKRGFLVFCIDYPLAPEAKTFEIINNASKGAMTAVKLIETYGGDKERIFLCGDSAGAFIAIYLAAAQKSEILAKTLQIEPFGLPIRGCGLISGMFYTTAIDKQFIFLLKKDFYGTDYRKQPFYKFSNPEHPQVVKNLPPCFFVTSKNDYLKEYTIQYARVCKKVGISTELLYYGENKELTHDFVCLKTELAESQEAIEKMIKAWKEV